jgi:DNA-binding Lrp family transcriptional regulator
VPNEVAVDRRLNVEHLRVYTVMASAVYQGSVARIGQRLIGRLVGLSAMTVGRRIQELVVFGHARASHCKNGERGWYELTSPVFGQKQGVATEIRSTPRGRRMVSIAAEDVA